MPRGRPRNIATGTDLKHPARKRTAVEARTENPETVFRESENLAARAEREGFKEGLALLKRLQARRNVA